MSANSISSSNISIPAIMLGSTSGIQGAVGATPPNAAGTQFKFLRGDGTWSTSISSINVQTFTTTGTTYTPSTNMVYCIVEMVGGGGAGGGGSATGAGSACSNGGGGAGSYAKALLTAAQIGASQAVTIGAGGIGATASVGGTGGTTSLGTLVSALGGAGGNTGGAISGTSFSAGGLSNGFTVSTGLDLGSVIGDTGGNGMSTGNTNFYSFGGNGASSKLGNGVRGQIIANGTGTANGTNAAANTGGGGGGSASANTAGGNQTGGNGGSGKIIITEFIA
jgi:hypothetical protein